MSTEGELPNYFTLLFEHLYFFYYQLKNPFFLIQNITKQYLQNFIFLKIILNSEYGDFIIVSLTRWCAAGLPYLGIYLEISAFWALRIVVGFCKSHEISGFLEFSMKYNLHFKDLFNKKLNKTKNYLTLVNYCTFKINSYQ